MQGSEKCTALNLAQSLKELGKVVDNSSAYEKISFARDNASTENLESLCKKPMLLNHLHQRTHASTFSEFSRAGTSFYETELIQKPKSENEHLKAISMQMYNKMVDQFGESK